MQVLYRNAGEEVYYYTECPFCGSIIKCDCEESYSIHDYGCPVCMKEASFSFFEATTADAKMLIGRAKSKNERLSNILKEH
jgi:hypothetical protein